MSAQKAVDLALSIKGKNQYTQTYLREQVFNGWSDCSSMVWKCYEKAYGINIGSWTGAQVGNGKQIFKRGKITAYSVMTKEEMAKLEPGDLIFYGYAEGFADHVEMYIGNGKQIGHGYGVGPKISDTLTYAHSGGVWQARRYYTDKTTTTAKTTTTTKPDAQKTAAPFPSYEPKYKVKVQDVDFLSVRTWAGTEFNRLVSVPKLFTGEVVQVCDQCVGSDGDIWYFAKVRDNVWGFIHSAYVKKI